MQEGCDDTRQKAMACNLQFNGNDDERAENAPEASSLARNNGSPVLEGSLEPIIMRLD